MTQTKVEAPFIQRNEIFRNKFCNGDFQVHQRFDGSATAASTAYMSFDRIKTLLINTGAAWTVEKETLSVTDLATTGHKQALEVKCTTADTSTGAAEYNAVFFSLEANSLQDLNYGTSAAKSLTVSFWVRSNKTGTYILELKDSDNTRSISQSYTISSADTWEKKTLTFAGDTTGTLDNDNAASFLVQFALAAGSDYTSGSLQTSWGAETTANRYVGQVNLADSTSNEWYMTGLQVEAGDTASEFEFLPYDVNLQRCKRYFEICGAAFTGGTSTTTNVDGSLQYSVNKRSDNGQSYSLERTTSALANPGQVAINAAAIAAVDSRRTNVGAYLSITVGATTADRKVSTYYQNWLKVDDEL